MSLAVASTQKISDSTDAAFLWLMPIPSFSALLVTVHSVASRLKGGLTCIL